MLKEFIKKHCISKFNKKWARKTAPFCMHLFDELYITKNESFFCCECTKSPYNPPSFHKGKPKFSFFKYINAIDKTLTQNIKGDGDCCSCKYVKELPVPEMQNKMISQFTLNHFTKCNANCVYCAIKDKSTPSKVRLKPYILQLEKENIISDDCLFIWGGGEPTIFEEFPALYKYLVSKNYHQHINTSAKLFSQEVYDALSKDGNSVMISPDAGTERTYSGIKRSNGFDQVWNNIKKYSEAGGNLIIKYIVFSLNSNKEEIEAFIQKCTENNVKSVQIDCEFNSMNGNFPPPVKITEKEITAAILLKDLCIENNISFSIGNNWSFDLAEKIKNSG